MSAAIAHQMPVQLQLNNSGAWKTIVKFDAADRHDSDQIMNAALIIQRVDIRNRFRIVTRQMPPAVLMHLDNLEWKLP